MTKKVSAPGRIVLLSAVCLTSIASAQTSWWRTYGGANPDRGYSVQRTTDGGYVVAGATSSFGAGSADVYLIKINAQGDTLWTRTYGGAYEDGGKSVQQTSDGGYIIAGYTYSFGPETPDSDNVYLIKTDASGDTLWTRTYGGPSYDEGNSVQQTTDGGYIVAGSTNSFGPGTLGSGNVYLIKISAQGDTLWTRTYGGAYEDEGKSVQQTSDGGYIIVGYTCSFGAGSADVYLIKTDAQGETLWTRTYGGANDDEGHSVRQTTDGGHIIAGYTYSFGTGGSYAWLIKTDASGDTLWTRTYANGNVGYSVQQTTDGGYILAGGVPQRVYLVKSDAQGDTLWTRIYGGFGQNCSYSVQQTSDSGYISAGWTNAFGAGWSDVYLIKTDANGNVGIEEPLNRLPANPTRFMVQPNPFISSARVPGHEAELFVLSDVTGRQVAICKGDRVGEGLRPGVYFLSPVELRTGGPATATVIKVAF